MAGQKERLSEFNAHGVTAVHRARSCDGLLGGCQIDYLRSAWGRRTVEFMAQTSRDTFSLRFKNPRNREALRRMADLTGDSMTDIAERAIEHEVALLAVDVERRLEDALAVVREYRRERDLDAYIDDASDGEESDLGDGLYAVARHAHSAVQQQPRSDVARDVLAAFAR